MSLFWRNRESEPSSGIGRVPRKSLPTFIKATINSLPDDDFSTMDDPLDGPDEPTYSKETPSPTVDAENLTFSELLDRINQSERLALEAKARERAPTEKVKGKTLLDLLRLKKRKGVIKSVERTRKFRSGQDSNQADVGITAGQEQQVHSASVWSCVENDREPGVIYVSDTISPIRIHHIHTSRLGLNSSSSGSHKSMRFGRYNFGKKSV